MSDIQWGDLPGGAPRGRCELAASVSSCNVVGVIYVIWFVERSRVGSPCLDKADIICDGTYQGVAEIELSSNVPVRHIPSQRSHEATHTANGHDAGGKVDNQKLEYLTSSAMRTISITTRHRHYAGA